jgi:hypothetical protein
MNRKLYSRLLLASTLVFLIQCSPGFKSENAGSTQSSNSNNSASQTPTPNAEAQRRAELAKIIASAAMTGLVAEGPSENSATPVIHFDRTNGLYLVRIPMTNFSALTAFDMTFKDYPGMRLFVEYVTELPYITLSIPVKYVLRNVTEVPAKLPNGDRVPFFPAGEPPSKGILLTPGQDRKVYLYLSAEAFGLFAETSFNPVPDLGPVVINEFVYTIRNKEKTKTLGYLTFVAKKADFKGGFFVSHRIDPKLGKILDEYYLD